MRTLRISLTDGQSGPYDESVDRQNCQPDQFWDAWNSHQTRQYWHRTELDLNGNPYTVKWYSYAFRNGCGAWVELTMAMEVDGEHPAHTRRQEAPKRAGAPYIPPGQQGRANIGERLQSPHGTWTVTESWIAAKRGAQGDDRDYRSRFTSSGGHVYYLLTHDDGHQEEWSAPDMGDFHRILPDQQQALT